MVIQSERVWIADQFIPAQLELKDGKITAIYEYKTHLVDLDYGQKRLVPGFIDVHTHGAYGYDTNDGDSEGLRHWIRNIPKEGVTGLLPTTVTQIQEVLFRAVSGVADVAEQSCEGAEILGVHFEGPFLDTAYRGAQPEHAIKDPCVESFLAYQQKARGWIKYITLAPEHDRDFQLTKYCAQTGVVVSMGHSSASYEQALMGIANGAVSMTHVFNGMSGFQPRSPGLTGAAYRVRSVYGEIICDGCHSHISALNHFYEEKGRDYTIMITDSLPVKHGKPEVQYQLGGQEIEVRGNGPAYIKGTDTIAGSTLCMNRGLQLLVEQALVPFDSALNSCTINPARCLRIDHRKGKLCAGYDGDIVVLDDNYDVIQTFCKGMAML